MYIIPTLSIGGTQRQLVNLIGGLIKKLEYYIEVSTLYKGGPIADELESLGVKINYINMKNIYDLFGLNRLTRLLKFGDFDIIHTFLFDANFLGALSARKAGVSCVISSRRDMDIWKARRHIRAERIGAKLSKKVIANSNAVKEFIVQQEKISHFKIEVIPNGIDLSVFHKDDKRPDLREEFGLSKDHFVIGTIGTLSEKKGQRFLIHSAIRILEVFNQARFIFVGDGPIEGELKKLTKRLNLSDKIIFTGLRKDIPAILSMFDLFCLPSVYESCPNAILEAMACSLPVVTTNVGGIPELVINGETGVLVPPQDTDALSKAIINLMKNGQSGEKMGQLGCKIVKENFNLARMIGSYMNLYEQSLHSSVLSHKSLVI